MPNISEFLGVMRDCPNRHSSVGELGGWENNEIEIGQVGVAGLGRKERREWV